MGTDSNGQFVPETRLVQTDVYLNQVGMLSAATKTALKAIPPALRQEGVQALVAADRSRWAWSAASTAADATENLVIAATDAPTAGRWLRTDKQVHLKLAIAFGTADAAVLFTVPAGMRLHLQRVFWEVTADWTGGSSSTIGVSSSQSGLSTKGDLAGAAAGSAAAALTAGIRAGTTTAAPAYANNAVVVLEAASTLRHDRITSAFTAGTGFVHVLAQQIT